ncbi:glycosyl transferase family 2 [Thioclava dalianensis]|uniref:Glycosyl transferase family 2 n=1 Tax=Thioclava dalianensis TaxID=1185766 RepID=A0A074TRI9_9RHOB|nr:glycosyltransferase family 2 protein [Thioclava dalianensis]KEP71593.1 glycosyl transferase family 2 [Thioclava dalianensis]SFN43735.1 Glycosyl transferase family 2 [Thioclava dalianensis]
MRALAITSVKNEGPFLLEWLAHHRAVGFTDFLVFSNDCDDGTDAMLDRLAELGWLTHLPNPGPWKEGPQWAALKRADAHQLVAQADWIAVIDVDEFVTVKTGDGSLSALIAACAPAGAIAMTWRLFGNAGRVAFEDRPISEQFTRCAPPGMIWPWRASMFKTLFANRGAYAKLGVHRPRAPVAERMGEMLWVDGSGRKLPRIYQRQKLFSPLGQDPYGLVQLNHYALGSMESYVVKCDRGRSNRQAGPFDMSYWVERNFSTQEDRSIARYTDQVAASTASLRADPVLARLHARAVAWRKARFATLMLSEEYRALFGRLLLSPPSHPLSPEATQHMIALGLRANAAAQETIADGARD